jgi:hypothetical protein
MLETTLNGGSSQVRVAFADMPPENCPIHLSHDIQRYMWDVLNWMRRERKSDPDEESEGGAIAGLAVQTACDHLDSHEGDYAGAMSILTTAYALNGTIRKRYAEDLRKHRQMVKAKRARAGAGR